MLLLPIIKGWPQPEVGSKTAFLNGDIGCLRQVFNNILYLCREIVLLLYRFLWSKPSPHLLGSQDTKFLVTKLKYRQLQTEIVVIIKS